MVSSRKKLSNGPRSSRPKNSVETQKRILAAAQEQFSRHTYSGARIDVIAKEAGVNTRMLYHYFGSKAGLYVAVLEQVLSELRNEELKINIDAMSAVDGILQMFDFIYDHFGTHPELVNLMSGENLMRGEFLKKSVATPTISSPVLAQVTTLLSKGQSDGTIRKGIDPLHLYVLMVGMSYFHRSNGYTLSAIFQESILDDTWQRDHHRFGREMLHRFIVAKLESENTGKPLEPRKTRV